MSFFNSKDVEYQSEILYSGVFKLVRYKIRHRLFEGDWSNSFTREVSEGPSSSAILPYDPVLDRIVLIEQFRVGAIKDPNSSWLIEIPAGILTKQAAHDEIAINEAKEEAGCVITELSPISQFYVSPGGSNEFLHVYCGKADLSNVGGVHGLKHENENIFVHNISFNEALQWLEQGKINTGPAVLALYWLRLNKELLMN